MRLTEDTADDGEAGAILESRALWIMNRGRCALVTEPLPQPENHQVRITSRFGGISRGTEALVFSGAVPPTEHERMRGPHQVGSFDFPVKYGYSIVGVAETGPLAGKPFFCLHPHQDRFVVDTADLVPVPEQVPMARAVLAANMETALNIVWDAEILPGERVLVFGAGVVGCLVAHLVSRIAGTDVELVDTNPDRAATADALALQFSRPGTTTGTVDVAINTSASGDALAGALETLGKEGRIVEASWYGDKVVTLPLGASFHSNRLSIVSSQVGTISARMRPRWSFRRRMEKAIDLLADDRLDSLISGQTGFDDLARAYPGILSNPATLCHRIVY